MDYNRNDMLRESIIPVLLGDCPAAHLMAARIYLRFGIVSYVCGEKPRFADRIDPFSKFFALGSAAEPRVVLDSLDYLASNKDYLPILSPTDEFFCEFVKQNKDFLETGFILSDKKSFFTKKPILILKKGASYEN